MLRKENVVSAVQLRSHEAQFSIAQSLKTGRPSESHPKSSEPKASPHTSTEQTTWHEFVL
jgi:hypothetical protein